MQVDYVKRVMQGLEYQAQLKGEFYFDLSSGQKLYQLAKSDVPRKVVVFSCGGGSFYEYE